MGKYGVGSQCKSCRKDYHHEYNKCPEVKQRSYINGKQWFLNNKEKRRAINRRSKYNNPSHVIAHNSINNAIHSGKLKRATTCAYCGIACIPEGHHEDYDKPLEVVWLCRQCHQHLHNERTITCTNI